MEERRGHHEEWKGHRTAPLDRQHKFSPKSFATPVPCDHCSQMIWGVLSNAVSCTECNYSCHVDCKSKVSKPCRVVADKQEVMSVLLTKPTYCNLCRSLLLSMIGKPGRICSVCKYLIHEECLDRAENSCAVCSDLYIEGGMDHHWVEGNLYLGTCIHCKESIGLGGMTNFRCSWCDQVIHSSCRTNYRGYCSLGDFEPLKIPPYAISSYEEGEKKFWKIVPQAIPSKKKPLIVFINKKSGGQQGDAVISSLLGFLNPLQIFDLGNGGPRPGLEALRPLIDNGGTFSILGCGGDGTIGWICSALDKAKFSPDNMPSIAVLPLGTGNDMSRTLGWGPGYNGENIRDVLEGIMKAETVWCDRWAVTITPLAEDEKDTNGEGGNVRHIISNNYFSIGIDAKVALDFHLARQADPDSFKSRKMNKIKYFGYGTSAVFDGTCRDLETKLLLAVDDHRVELPRGLEGLVVLNLPSYAGGADLWGTTNEGKFQVPSINDELLEVVALTGSLHLAQIKTRTANAIQIAQGKTVKIILSAEMPAQIDGEPWLQKPAVFDVQYHNRVRMLKNTASSSLIPEDLPLTADPSDWVMPLATKEK